MTPPEPTDSSDDFSLDDTAKIMEALRVHETVAAMSDSELSDAVLKEIWAELPFCSRREWLLDEYMSRFEKRCGIVRDDETGEVASVDPLKAALDQTLAQGHPVVVGVDSSTADLKQAILTPISS